MLGDLANETHTFADHLGVQSDVRVELIQIPHIIVADIMNARVALVVGGAAWTLVRRRVCSTTAVAAATCAGHEHCIDEFVDTATDQITHTALILNRIEQSSLALRGLLGCILCRCLSLVLHA